MHSNFHLVFFPLFFLSSSRRRGDRVGLGPCVKPSIPIRSEVETIVFMGLPYHALDNHLLSLFSQAWPLTYHLPPRSFFNKALRISERGYVPYLYARSTPRLTSDMSFGASLVVTNKKHWSGMEGHVGRFLSHSDWQSIIIQYDILILSQIEFRSPWHWISATFYLAVDKIQIWFELYGQLWARPPS